MLEYETANPGQDRAKPQAEAFNPDLDQSQPGVSFAPEEYAMEESLPDNNRIGLPREYGTARRPYSDSPAPPNPNDQFAGLNDGGIHAAELAKTRETPSMGSERTLGPNSRRPVANSAMKPGVTNTQGVGVERSVKANTQTNRNNE